MELKVWVDGIQRIVCGVTENTTCQDVVYALAHATGKTGRFTLSERWRSSERLLSPQDNPLRVLLKWGEYSNDVQFILQRSILEDKPSNPTKTRQDQYDSSMQHDLTHDKYKDIKKSLTFTGTSPNADALASRIGVVKGVPKLQDDLEVRESKQLKFDMSPKSENNGVPHSPSKREAPPYREPPSASSSPHQRALPPYRNPPPPTASPGRTALSGASSPVNSMITQANCKALKPKRSLGNDNPLIGGPGSPENNSQEAVLCNSQYRDLIRLVNFQRDKLSAQQSELTKVL